MTNWTKTPALRPWIRDLFEGDIISAEQAAQIAPMQMAYELGLDLVRRSDGAFRVVNNRAA